MPYAPTATDVMWAKNLVAMLREDGAWILPSTMLIYRINHTVKSLTLQNPERLDDRTSFMAHDAIRAVFGKLGYSVKEKRDD